MNVIIYLRYSSDMQRQDSCVDQERKVREGLDRLEIDHSDAEVIRDEAVSGTRDNRQGYVEIGTRIASGNPLILAVDDQSRLSRGDNVKAFVQDIVFNGGRFISTGEGIDTVNHGWEVQVGIGQIHNSLTIADLSRRVYRGQEGRVRDGCGSAGDVCYGYRTELAPGEKESNSGRGPKPKRIMVIHEAEKKWILRAFQWFNEGKSIGSIARELTKLKAPKGRKATKPGWHHQQVRRLLTNTKYIGEWVWGKTKTKRDGQGRKKQVPVDEALIIRVSRPELRIVDDGTWQKAQNRLTKLHGIYGPRKGQRARGPSHRGTKYHYTVDYPTTLLGGLIFCGRCGSRLVYQSGGSDVYYGCPADSKMKCDTPRLS